jgi:hypothetical protein
MQPALVAEGWRIRTSRGAGTRRPYTRIFLYRGSGPSTEKLTVNLDGSTRPGWGAVED